MGRKKNKGSRQRDKSEMLAIKGNVDFTVYDYTDAFKAEIGENQNLQNTMDEGKPVYDHTEESNYNEYPLDLWAMISDYISPEDIGTFAGICQSTRFITSRARFWLNLYKRHHRWLPDIPEELNRWNIDRIRGLRQAVIRALFYFYQPFTLRLSSECALNADFSVLFKCMCILQWQMRQEKSYLYCFKLRQERNGFGTKVNSSLPDIIPNSLIFHNPEEGCYLLEVICSHLCHVGMVIGKYLVDAGLGITSNQCGHKVRIQFSPGHLINSTNINYTPGARRLKNIPHYEVVLDSAVDVKIYPWWHPRYKAGLIVQVNEGPCQL